MSTFGVEVFFVLSISGANIEIIKKYIQEQGGGNEDS